ncbi:MAG: CRISPR-associated helicase Cas3' [Acidobacteria bacterium]|nr:CRISPR-associated helicase Cas3' [Acidobacteriota bacterium]
MRQGHGWRYAAGNLTPPIYYAHSNSAKDRHGWQRLSDHLKGTAERAGAFLEATGHTELGRAAGLLHDLGKYTEDFQARLTGEGRRVDHAGPGAKVAIDTYGPTLGKLLAFGIAGHHAGLANGVNTERITALADRLRNAAAEPDPVWKQEIDLQDTLEPPRLAPRSSDTVGFCAAFLIRMVFSALVDADYLDTEAYYTAVAGESIPRGRHPALADLQQRLDTHLDGFGGRRTGDESRPIDQLRSRVLRHAREQAAQPPGLFTLTVPTGGGKTLTSLAFALDHALHHGLERVIYVIPYMSIIEQTASVFRAALREGDEDADDFVVEHHSTFDEDRISKREAVNKLRLAMENWDAPLIVTTAVQFFESLFANRPSRCRKLHNIANSVVILDEAQTLPHQVLRPCVAALDELARNWRTSVVLCTATQPALTETDGFTGGFEHVRELAPQPRRLYTALKRTRIQDAGTLDDAALASGLCESSQVLCIVNTRRHARELYEQLGDAEGSYHLSTLMCAAHRREVLRAVRRRLKDGDPVRLVATSLVEAGVDVDFPVVWRAAAGLESLVQAAGRCNREGRRDTGNVFVFEPTEEEGRKPPPEVAQCADAARSILRQFPDDPASLDAIRAYFRQIYWTKGEEALDSKDIMRMISDARRSLDFPFETIATQFHLIDEFQVPVVTTWRGPTGKEATVERLLDKLHYVERPGWIARRLQPYVVQIGRVARETLLSAGAATVLRESDFGCQFVQLVNADLYHEDTGLWLEDPAYRRLEGLVF